MGQNGSWIVLKSDGERMSVSADEVEDVADLQQSAMPEGLLNNLSPRDVADLLRFLESEKLGRVADSANGLRGDAR